MTIDLGLPDTGDDEQLPDATIELPADEDDSLVGGDGTDTPAGGGADTAAGAGGGPAALSDDARKTRRAERGVIIQRMTTAERERDELKQRLADAEKRGTEFAQRATVGEHVAMTHYGERLKLEQVHTERALQEAIDNADTKAQAAAASALARIASEQARVDEWNATHPAPGAGTSPPPPPPAPTPKPPATPARAAAPAVEVDPTTIAWVEKNPWMDPDSDSFNPVMSNTVMSYAMTLENQLRQSNRGAEIGKEAYWGQIEAFARRAFPSEFSTAAAPAARNGGGAGALPPMTRGTTAAPVTRSTAATAAAGGGRPATQVALSGDERKLARSLAANGAITGPGGARLTPEQAEVVYARQKLKGQN